MIGLKASQDALRYYSAVTQVMDNDLPLEEAAELILPLEEIEPRILAMGLVNLIRIILIHQEIQTGIDPDVYLQSLALTLARMED